MRVLAACLLGFLGLGALATMAACSDSTDAGMGGAGGTAAVAGSGGKAAGGSTSAGGGPGCTFLSEECSTTCIQGNCAALLNSCGMDGTCGEALQSLTLCACNPSKDAMDCKATFATAGGDKAVKLIECYDLNSCADVCE